MDYYWFIYKRLLDFKCFHGGAEYGLKYPEITKMPAKLRI